MLVTICDNCHDDWCVDSLTFVEAVGKNCCPNCLNQLVDLCFARLNDSQIFKIKQELEDM